MSKLSGKIFRMLNKQAMELMRSVYSEPKPKAKKVLEKKIKGSYGCIDFHSIKKPPIGCVTRIPTELRG